MNVKKNKIVEYSYLHLKKCYQIYTFHPVFFLIFFAIFFLTAFYLLNYYTPLLSDDYSYCFIFGSDNEKITSIQDIFVSEYEHYHNWGGRVIVHFLAQVFLLLGKPFFNIINSLGYLALTFLIYFHVNAYKPIRVSLYVIINLLLWFFIPLFGESMLWLTGASNYLWGTLIVLAFLLPYRLYSEKKEFKFGTLQTILFTLFAFFAGWTNENTAGAAILLVILFMFYYKKRMQVKIPTWAISGLIAAFIGYIFLIAAPGNFVRATSFEHKYPYIIEQLIVSVYIIRDFYLEMYPLLFIGITLFIFYIRYNKYNSTLEKILMYFIVSMASIFCMFLSPGGFPLRAWTGPMCYMFIVIGLLYIHLPNTQITRRLKRLSLIFVIIPFCVSYTYALLDARHISIFVENRTAEVIKQIENGATYVETTYIIADDNHNPRVTYDDITPATDFYGNKFFSAYYGLDSIKAIEKDPYDGVFKFLHSVKK